MIEHKEERKRGRKGKDRITMGQALTVMDMFIILVMVKISQRIAHMFFCF